MEDEDDQLLDVKSDDDAGYPFDNEDDFLDMRVIIYEKKGYKCYYFGDGDDGAMRTGKDHCRDRRREARTSISRSPAAIRVLV